MSERYRTFREFYPFYLSQHANPVCRRLHFVGTALVIVFLATAFATRNAWWLVGAVIVGYGLGWVGHFFFEHNRPATFTYPLYSFMGDWVMFKDLLTRKIRF